MQYNYIDCYGPKHLVALLERIQLLKMITSFMDQWFQVWGTSVGVNHFVYGMHCDNGVLSLNLVILFIWLLDRITCTIDSWINGFKYEEHQWVIITLFMACIVIMVSYHLPIIMVCIHRPLVDRLTVALLTL